MNLAHPQFPVYPVHRSTPMANPQYDATSNHSSWHTDVQSSPTAHLSDYLPSPPQYSWSTQDPSAWPPLSSNYNNFGSHSDPSHASSETSFTPDTAQPSSSHSQQPHHLPHSQSPSQQQYQQKSFSSVPFPSVGSFSYPSLASSSSSTSPPSPKDGRPRFAPASWDGHDLYRIEPDLDQDPPLSPNPQPHATNSTAVDPSTPSTPRSPSIVKKEEEPEDGFVFELSSNTAHQTFAPMTEVPLRATHASKSQRKLMTSFRLDPFATQNGIRANTDTKNWLGEDIGPHTEEPVMIEFQIELTVPLISPSLTNSPLPPFEEPADFFSMAPRVASNSTLRPTLPLPANSPLTQYLRGAGTTNGPASSHQMFPPTPPQLHPSAPTSIHTSSPNLLYPYEDRDYDDEDAWMHDEPTSYPYSNTQAQTSRGVEMSIGETGADAGTVSPGATFESVMTPAQSLQWQMGFQAGNPDCMSYPNGVTTSKPARVNVSSRYHSTQSQLQLKRHTLSNANTAYQSPAVDVGLVFPASRSSAHHPVASYQASSPQRVGLLNAELSADTSQEIESRYPVSSSGVHWNRNHTSSASSVSSLTDDDEPFIFPTEANPWPSRHVSSGPSSAPSTRHTVTSSSSLSSRRWPGGTRQRQTHAGGPTACYA